MQDIATSVYFPGNRKAGRREKRLLPEITLRKSPILPPSFLPFPIPQPKTNSAGGSEMRMLFLGILTLASPTNGQISRTCSDTPQGLPTFNPDWYYSEFIIPENFQIVSLFGGFDRPGYIPAHQDYIAQFYRPGQTISGLDDYQLFNYDLIDDPLYNQEFNIENLNVVGEGILRFSVPLTHGVVWNEACVSIQPHSLPESVPEPVSLALMSLGLVFLGVIRFSKGRN